MLLCTDRSSINLILLLGKNYNCDTYQINIVLYFYRLMLNLMDDNITSNKSHLLKLLLGHKETFSIISINNHYILTILRIMISVRSCCSESTLSSVTLSS